MTPTWTGKAGEPVPAMLRHDLRETYTEGPGGVALWACNGCDASGFMAAGVDPDWLPTTLCPAAVAQRIAELEAHGASIHKAVNRSRRGIVRWLRDSPCCADAEHDGRWCPICIQDSDRADAIDRGDDVAWCEANTEIPPAPVGADAGRVPGSSEE